MEWYIIAALIILLLVVLVVKNPTAGMKIFSSHTMRFLRKNEAYIVLGIYNIMPKELKVAISSLHTAQLVSLVIFYIGRLLKENGSISEEVASVENDY